MAVTNFDKPVGTEIKTLNDQIASYGIKDTSPNLPNTTIGAGDTSILTLTGFTGRKLVNVSAVGDYPVGTKQKFIITSAWIEGDNLNVAVTNISGSSHSGVLQVQVLYVTNIQNT